MTTTALAIPPVPFATVAARIDRFWNPLQRNTHQVVFGTSGSGKSWLIRHGILPIRPLARTVILDMKSGRDETWSGFGAPVDELPRAFSGGGDGPANMRYRLIVSSKEQLKRALEQIRDEGRCILVIDESRSITEPQRYGLGSLVENIILETRGLGVTVILGAQSPAWAVPSIKDQPAAVWVARQRNRDKAKELAAIAGYDRALAETIGKVPPHHWIYTDTWEADQILGLTPSPEAKEANEWR